MTAAAAPATVKYLCLGYPGESCVVLCEDGSGREDVVSWARQTVRHGVSGGTSLVVVQTETFAHEDVVLRRRDGQLVVVRVPPRDRTALAQHDADVERIVDIVDIVDEERRSAR